MKLRDVMVTPKQKKKSSLNRKRQEQRAHTFSGSIGGDKSNYKKQRVSETEGELLPYDESTAMQLAKDLFRGAKGDADKAKQMAQYMIQQVIANIDKHAQRVSMKTTSGERIR